MRFLIMHKTNAHWESGAVPTHDLIARVGTLLGQLSKAGALEAGEGLRPSSEGVRLRFAGGTRTVISGPFELGNELPAAFSIVRASSLDEAVAWASEQAAVLGDVEIDIRPVTEPWDIGMGRKPQTIATRRYMVLRKATALTEAGVEPSAGQRAALLRLSEETTRTGMHLATETMRPSRRGRRYTKSREGISAFDGPFTESKELIGGYVIVSTDSIETADRWARQYIDTVESEEVDLRELVPSSTVMPS